MGTAWMLALVVAVESSTTASAPREEPPPPNRLFVQSLTAIRVNPLGLLEVLTASYRSRIQESREPLWLDNFGGLGIAAEVSPAFVRAGPLLEVQPLSILRLWTTFQGVGYFGSFKLLQSFTSPNEEWSDDALDALSESDTRQSYATTGTQLTLGANFQIKVRDFALRAALRAVRASYDLREGDTVFYDQFYDILAPNDGWYLNEDTDLLWVSDFGLAAGVRWTLAHAFYEARHFPRGEVDRGLNPTMHRIGPFLAYTFFKDPAGAAFNNPTLVLIANWWLAHRYRTGSEVSQALPYVAVAFNFTGDLWTSVD